MTCSTVVQSAPLIMTKRPIFCSPSSPRFLVVPDALYSVKLGHGDHQSPLYPYWRMGILATCGPAGREPSAASPEPTTHPPFPDAPCWNACIENAWSCSSRVVGSLPRLFVPTKQLGTPWMGSQKYSTAAAICAFHDSSNSAQREASGGGAGGGVSGEGAVGGGTFGGGGGSAGHSSSSAVPSWRTM